MIPFNKAPVTLWRLIFLSLVLAAWWIGCKRSSPAEQSLAGTYYPNLAVRAAERDARRSQNHVPGEALQGLGFTADTPMLVLAADHTFQIHNLPVIPDGSPAKSLSTNGTWTEAWVTQGDAQHRIYRTSDVRLRCGGEDLVRARIMSNPEETNPILELNMGPGMGLDNSARLFKKVTDSTPGFPSIK